MDYKDATAGEKQAWRDVFCTPDACDKEYLCREWRGMEEDCFELHQEDAEQEGFSPSDNPGVPPVEKYPEEFKEALSGDGAGEQGSRWAGMQQATDAPLSRRRALVLAEGLRKCCACTRQHRINSTAWIYCEIYNNEMLKIPGFDETGETQGCSEYESSYRWVFPHR